MVQIVSFCIETFSENFEVLGGRPSVSMLDDLLALGRPSCIGTTFLDLDNTMDELEIVQFLVHRQIVQIISKLMALSKWLDTGNSYVNFYIYIAIQYFFFLYVPLFL